MKTVIDRISQPIGPAIVVYSDGTTEPEKKVDLNRILIETKKRGIKKKTKVFNS